MSMNDSKNFLLEKKLTDKEKIELLQNKIKECQKQQEENEKVWEENSKMTKYFIEKFQKTNETLSNRNDSLEQLLNEKSQELIDIKMECENYKEKIKNLEGELEEQYQTNSNTISYNTDLILNNFYQLLECQTNNSVILVENIFNLIINSVNSKNIHFTNLLHSLFKDLIHKLKNMSSIEISEEVLTREYETSEIQQFYPQFSIDDISTSIEEMKDSININDNEQELSVIYEKGTIISEKENNNNSNDTIISEKENNNNSNDTIISEKENNNTNNDTIISEKESNNTNNDTIISEKENNNNNNDTIISEKDNGNSTISTSIQDIENLKHEQEILEDENKMLKDRLEDYKNEIMRLQHDNNNKQIEIQTKSKSLNHFKSLYCNNKFVIKKLNDIVETFEQQKLADKKYVDEFNKYKQMYNSERFEVMKHQYEDLLSENARLRQEIEETSNKYWDSNQVTLSMFNECEILKNSLKEKSSITITNPIIHNNTLLKNETDVPEIINNTISNSIEEKDKPSNSDDMIIEEELTENKKFIPENLNNSLIDYNTMDMMEEDLNTDIKISDTINKIQGDTESDEQLKNNENSNDESIKNKDNSIYYNKSVSGLIDEQIDYANDNSKNDVSLTNEETFIVNERNKDNDSRDENKININNDKDNSNNIRDKDNDNNSKNENVNDSNKKDKDNSNDTNNKNNKNSNNIDIETNINGESIDKNNKIDDGDNNGDNNNEGNRSAHSNIDHLMMDETSILDDIIKNKNQENTFSCPSKNDLTDGITSSVEKEKENNISMISDNKTINSDDLIDSNSKSQEISQLDFSQIIRRNDHIDHDHELEEERIDYIDIQEILDANDISKSFNYDNEFSMKDDLTNEVLAIQSEQEDLTETLNEDTKFDVKESIDTHLDSNQENLPELSVNPFSDTKEENNKIKNAQEFAMSKNKYIPNNEIQTNETLCNSSNDQAPMEDMNIVPITNNVHENGCPFSATDILNQNDHLGDQQYELFENDYDIRGPNRHDHPHIYRIEKEYLSKLEDFRTVQELKNYSEMKKDFMEGLIIDLRDENSQLKEKIDTLQQTLTQLKNQVHTSNLENIHIEEEFAKLERKNENLNTLYQKYKDIGINLNQEIQMLTNEWESTFKHNTDYMIEYKKRCDEKISTLKSAVVELNERSSYLRNILTQLFESLNDINSSENSEMESIIKTIQKGFLSLEL
ncbi:hypothetical protein BCR36DRAFT_323842 [Piromyces finnis]|uniref:Uncharacterized protein n=1 Tax=Piromyces finnis TaxID=1754191 RepID=A0A1Y1VEQ5_9FUNG|nr:hypothetical protein BCR36DRAFT_323842 [Piromyces finnis]|eukprot:ORX53466.1 hypothetical protein BCR36DRAFT_323842 [Piromyces finnis]